MKKVILSAAFIAAFVSCKNETVSTKQQEAVTQASIDQYNKDEVEMIENTDTVNYKSIDGSRIVKVIYTPKIESAKDKDKDFLKIQLTPKEAFLNLDRKREDNGNPVYANQNKSWTSKETGGKGTLFEGDKKTEFIIE